MSDKAAVIGTFDGVHLGHIAVLHKLKEEADNRGLTPIAITFDRHPLALIDPQRAPKRSRQYQRKRSLFYDPEYCRL